METFRLKILKSKKYLFTLKDKVLFYDMKDQNESNRQLHEIHEMMSRSSRFISLSGISGVAAGIIALAGAAIAYFAVDDTTRYFEAGVNTSRAVSNSAGMFLVWDALVVLVLAIISSVYFTTRRAKRRGLKIWNETAKRLLANLFIPLVMGGVFCLILMYYALEYLVAPATLIFYGLALFNAGKYTYNEIRILGLSEALIGLTAAFLPAYGLIFWAIGFGMLHIIYGLVMYRKYETTNN